MTDLRGKTIAVARARHGMKVVLGLEVARVVPRRREPTFEVGRWMAA